jgi:hypothetical protein
VLVRNKSGATNTSVAERLKLLSENENLVVIFEGNMN